MKLSLIAMIAITVSCASMPTVGVGPPATSSHCAVRGALPDPICTPGDIDTTDLALICGQSTKERRSVSASVHRQVFAEYGIAYPAPAGYFECDHLVSLELGGSNAIANLWPEAAEPRLGYHEKDRLENALHRHVCAGEMTLSAAQHAIATDWLSAYHTEFGR